ncbi:MAG TPA: succinate dehydrogenase, cytochrome b556 subunit [Acidiferrobacterales bacterium]|jgi:succinate dehydrogenase / fumarate reductase cytochrome b subunit
MDKNKKRPVYLNLVAIRLPIGGMVSILHRVSGVLLVFALPVSLYALQTALSGADGYARVVDAFASWPARLALLLTLWMLAHHFFAGLRHLLFDLDIGIGRLPARFLALGVLVATAAVTVAAAWGLFA